MPTPSLPDGAPPEVRRFVGCQSMSLELDTGELGWFPKPDWMPDGTGPTISVEEGWTPTTATVNVGLGDFISTAVQVAIVDGHLSIATDQLPDGLGRPIDRWVDQFNATLTENGKGLDSFAVRGTRLTITKRAVASNTSSVGGAGMMLAAAPSAASPVAAAPTRGQQPKLVAAVIGIVVALVAAGGIAWAALRDGGESNSDVATPEAVEPERNAVPATDEPPDDQPDEPPGPIQESPRDLADESAFVPWIPICGDPVPDADVFRAPNVDELFDDVPCEGDPSLFCRDERLCVTDGGGPLILIAPGSRITHNGSAPDAVTGQTGLSEVAPGIWIVPFGAQTDGWWFRAQADCNGNLSTGQEPVVADALTLAGIPLYQFGNCAMVDAGVITPTHSIGLPPSAFGTNGLIPIGPQTVDAIAPDPSAFAITDSRFAVDASWADHGLTVRNALADAPVPAGCSWFFAPSSVDVIDQILNPCRPGEQYWVFEATAGTPPDLDGVDLFPIATAGGYLNSDGIAGPSGATIGPAVALFTDATFPCGAGHVGFTICETGPIPAANGFGVVSIIFAEPIPLEPTGEEATLTVDLGSTAYTLTPSPGAWKLTSPQETEARAILRGNSATFVFPEEVFAEIPNYTVLLDDRPATRPNAPFAGLATSPEGEPPEVSPTQSAETLVDFYQRLSDSLSTGDLTFAEQRLHPTVLAAYPDSCPATLASFVDPDFSIEPLSEGSPEPWQWELPDGRSFDLPDAIAVEVRLSGRGQTGTPTTAHVVKVGAEHRWFTNCTAPP